MPHYKEVTKLEKIIRTVLPGIPMMPVQKRVASYTRVSSGKDAMLHSLSAQVSYYSNLIQRNPEWAYAGVYADEALTGTKDSREDFQRLLSNCRAGKIDMVITKSISRFARNTVTLLETVRELKSLGVDVYFEEQNIHSISGDGELLLTILASYAQEESRSVSENCKWRIQKRYELGENASWRYMYGYRIHKGVVSIHTEEAAIVRWIYRCYLDGIGVCPIARMMREANVPSYWGGIWTPNRVLEILKNEKYAGNSMLQKMYVVDHMTKLKKLNRGELPRYFAEGTHPAIISVEDFNAVQEKIALNRLRNNIACDTPQFTAFTSMIVCENCGKKYRRKIKRDEAFWQCSTYLKLGKKECHAKQTPEDILMTETAAVLGEPEFDEWLFKELIQEIRVPAFNHLVYVFKDGTKVEREWKDKSRRDSWTDEMRAQAAVHARRRYA